MGLLLAGQQAVFIAHLPGNQRQGIEADHAAVLVLQGRRRDVGAVVAVQHTTGAVIQARGIDLQRCRAQHAAATVIHLACADHRARAAQRRALVVEVVCSRHCQGAAGNHALGIFKAARRHADIAIGIARFIGVDARFDDPAVGDPASTGQANAVAGGEAFLVDQALGAGDMHAAAGVDLVGQVDVLRGDLDVAGGGGLRQAQMPIGIQLDIAAAGRQGAVELHAHTGFGAHQFDRTGVHAAQCRRVDCQLRLGAAVIGTRRRIQGLRVNVVAPGDHGQVARIDLGIDLG